MHDTDFGKEVAAVLEEATRAAGAYVQSKFGGTFSVENKPGVNNLVTEVDKGAETIIIQHIRSRFPNHHILSEEAGELRGEGAYTWIIDPIDGTTNFAHGIPLCCVSVAVAHDGALVAGAIYNPMMNEFFFARRGHGATLNGQPMQVSEKTDFARACLVTGFPYFWPHEGEHPIRTFERFIMRGLPVRRLGSAALDLAWVACGRFDGFWEYNLNPWDVAAGYLLVEEAGGTVTCFDGGAGSVFDRETLATNGRIHEAMRALILNRTEEATV